MNKDRIKSLLFMIFEATRLKDMFDKDKIDGKLRTDIIKECCHNILAEVEAWEKDEMEE